MTKFGDDAFLERWGRAWTDASARELVLFYTPDARYRDVGTDTTCAGHAAIERFQSYMRRFAPDSRVEFDSAYGDRRGFAADWTRSGTAAGPLRVPGAVHPATGATFSVRGIAYCKLGADGLIADHEDYYDMLDVIRQVRNTG